MMPQVQKIPSFQADKSLVFLLGSVYPINDRFSLNKDEISRHHRELVNYKVSVSVLTCWYIPGFPLFCAARCFRWCMSPPCGQTEVLQCHCLSYNYIY